MNRYLKYALFLGFTGAALPQAMACYTVYDGTNRIVYNAQTPPVDMSYQIHQTLPRVFPGFSHMVFGNEPDCPLEDARLRAAVVPVAATTYRVYTVTTAPQAGTMRPKPDRN
jgi:hypothetical protein